MAFDLTCLATVQANSRSASLGLGRLRAGSPLSASAGSSRPLSRSCTRNPPATCRKVSDAGAGSGSPPVVSSRRFFLRREKAAASASRLGRDDHFGEDRRRSPRRSPHRAAGSAPRCRRRPRSGRSHRRACRPPAAMPPVATPQGLACLMIAQAGRPRVEFGDQFEGGVGVVDVVVAQFLALMLRRGRHARAGPSRRCRRPPTDAGSRRSAGVCASRPAKARCAADRPRRSRAAIQVETAAS